MPFDQVELSNTRACVGRLYFQVPGGITYGQHWLNVKFEKSLVRVRMPTHDELPITREQRVHPTRHPRHVSGGLMVHMTGVAGWGLGFTASSRFHMSSSASMGTSWADRLT